MRRSLLAIFGASATVLAQDSTTSSSTTSFAAAATSSVAAASSTAASSTSSGPVTHTIGVAEGGFTFVPNVVLADVGDVIGKSRAEWYEHVLIIFKIEYQFYPTNHSVVRSLYGWPCIPYEDTGVDRIGFFSGFQPVDTPLPDPPTFRITVNDTEPIFYYCSALGSCLTKGMVGVINPNATQSVLAQTQLALNSSIMLQPGEAWPSESEDPFTTGGSSPTSTSSSISTATAPAATTSVAAVSSSSHSGGLSPGGIAGVAIGAAAVALLAAALLFLCGRASRKPQSLPQPAPYPVSFYSDATGKHMSILTDGRHSAFYPRQSGVYNVPAAMPGYIPEHDPAQSPPLAAVKPSTIPSSISEDTRSEEATVPAYLQGQPLHGIPTVIQDHGVYEIPPQGPHEMPAADQLAVSPATSDQGVLGYLRRASMRKSGGVERYG